MLVVPLGVIGALLAATGRGLSNDVYFQVGLLTTIGLSAKNAILIVEFAKELHEGGKSLYDATIEAVRMRLRPILMTSIAFILGVLPLVIANGAGSGSQNAIGTGVAGGMITATVLAIFFVPLFFVVVNRFFHIPDAPTEDTPAQALPRRRETNMTKQLFLVTALAAALSACTLAPTYQRPASPVGAFPTGGAYGDNVATQGKTLAADIGWQDFFADARLQKLIELSLQNNRDLRVAVLQVEQARAQYQISRADLFPTVNAAADGTRAHTPANMNTSGREVTGNSFSANLGFTAYELDLFGRVQSLKNAALETYFGTAEAQKTAQITLVSEVASQYLTVLSAEAQLNLANETLKSYQASFDLTKRRFDVGAASALDLASVQSQLNTAQGAAASAIQQKSQAENALAFLIGQPLPADLPPEPSWVTSRCWPICRPVCPAICWNAVPTLSRPSMR